MKTPSRWLGLLISLAPLVVFQACSSDDGATQGQGDAGIGGGAGATGGAGGTGAAGSGGLGASAGDAAIDSPSDASTLAQDCSAYADAFCKRLGECWPQALTNSYETSAACKIAVSSECGDLAPWQVQFADIGQCTSYLVTAECVDVAYPVGLNEQPGKAPCNFAPGALAKGEGCASNVACQSGLCRFSGSRCGTCEETVGLGETCGNGVECEPNAVCEADKCVPQTQLGLGDSCSASSSTSYCKHHLYCAASGKCEALAKEGETCGGGVECDFVAGFTCDTPSSKCVKADLKLLSETCGLPFPRCSLLAYCEPTQLVCVPRKAEGENCDKDPVQGHTCLPDLVCDNGTCKSVQDFCKN